MKFTKQNIITGIIILITIPIGIFSKFYNGPGYEWVNNSLSDIFYVIFWDFVLFLFIKKPLQIIIIVFIWASLIEFSQLLHTPFLEKIRSYFIGRTLIGTTFDWTDFIYYLAGSVIAFVVLKYLKKRYSK